MKVAYIFPGQGSAEVGMGAPLFAADAGIGDYFARASALLGRDLKKITLEGPEATLVATENAQPAIFCLAAACYDIFRSKYAETRGEGFYAGHSLGEYTALYAAGALDFDTALGLVCRRGQYVADAGAAAPGTMGAVLGLEDGAVEELCRDASSAGVVVPANYNAPGQVVISGEPAAVAKAGELAAARGGKFTALKVSGAFHSPLVAPAAERMRGELAAATVAAPRGTFLPNVTAAPAADPAVVRDALYRQIASPVRWRATMDYMLGEGVTAAVEFGHGRVLAGVFKKVKRDLPVFNVADEASADAAAAALGRLARGE